MRGVVEACASSSAVSSVCAIKMCRVVPYAAAGELVHALADARGTFLVGEQGQIRIQVPSPSLSPPTDSTRPEVGWPGGKECCFVRLVVCIVSGSGNGNNSSTAVMIIPRTSERNSSLPIAPPVPSIPLPSYFASHPGACSPLACLACLHAKSTWNQFDQEILLEPHPLRHS